MGVGGQLHAPAALPRERDPVPIVQEAGWAPWPVWTGAKNLAPTRISFILMSDTDRRLVISVTAFHINTVQ
jgi:hypothetical protein